jgi:glycosyltransferase involved in cell wall biosynthesis
LALSRIYSQKDRYILNIWMLNHYAHPADIPGGTRHFDFARDLVKQGHRVSIFASGFNHRTREDVRLTGNQSYRRENVDGVKFLWIRTSPYYEGNDWRRAVNMLSYGFRVIPLGLRLRERPDIILASSPHLFTGLAGYILSKAKGAGYIFEVRDLWPQTFVEIGGYSNKSPIIRLLRVLEKFLYNRARKIVVLLPKASDYITKLGIPINKIVYIPNGVNRELYSRANVRLPEGLDALLIRLKSEGKILAGYAGAHGIANALDTIIETARLLQEGRVDKIHFLLVGDGAEKQRLVEKAEKWSLNNVSFISSIPKYTMPTFLRAIDIAMRAGRRSGLSIYGTSLNKIFDYMASGKPVIWTDTSVNNPVADAQCGLTVSPENPEEMAKAVLKLSELGDEERQEMGMRGYEYVMKYHSVSVLAKRLMEVVEEVGVC